MAQGPHPPDEMDDNEPNDAQSLSTPETNHVFLAHPKHRQNNWGKTGKSFAL